MKLANVISEEAKNTGSIIMYREGLFWRVYEKSAFMFTLHLRQYSATKKFFKTVNSEIVFIGFPNQTLNQIIGKAQGKAVEQSESRICIGGFEFNKEAYLLWKNGIDLTEKSMGKKIDRTTEDANRVEKFDREQSTVIERIRHFPVIRKTPLECQEFIVEIQNQLNGSL